MAIKFSKIHVDDLQFVYEDIEEKLRYIIKKSNSDWLPADVYVGLKTKQADLYIAYEGDENIGFIITENHPNIGGGPTLFETSRSGWQKVAPKHGFKLVSYTYRKDL